MPNEAPPWLRKVADGLEVDVWVVPAAARTEVVGRHGDAIKVRVAAPAEGGRANRAVVAVIAAATGGRVTLLRGRAARRKTLLIRGVAADDVVDVLAGTPQSQG